MTETNEIQIWVNNCIKEAHSCAIDHGFHSPQLDLDELIVLVDTEICEAINAHRAGKVSEIKPYTNRWVYSMISSNDAYFKREYEDFVKDSVESELAGACIRIFDMAGVIAERNHSGFHIPDTTIPEDTSFLKDCKGVMDCLFNNDMDNEWMINFQLQKAVGFIFCIAIKEGIEIHPHIDAEMRYNQLREYKHGKKY